jgi:hypothetical protein
LRVFPELIGHLAQGFDFRMAIRIEPGRPDGVLAFRDDSSVEADDRSNGQIGISPSLVGQLDGVSKERDVGCCHIYTVE